MKQYNKPMKQLSKELRVSTSYLSQVKHGKRPASEKVLSKISEEIKQSLPEDTNNDTLIERGPLAQLAEQLTLNQQVEGSSPSRLTII